MKHDGLVRLWFGAVRAAADEGEKEVPEDLKLSPLQKAKLHILTRQDLSDFLWLSIRSTEDLSTEAADRVWEDMYSDLMEDAIAGIWNEQENLELARYMSLCSEGIGDTQTYCEYFRKILPEAFADDCDAAAKRIEKRADKYLDDFIVKRKKLFHSESRESDDAPPPDLDEFEYIDWLMSH
ncbi:MAG: hypothetical protein J5889_04740 [Clostridia bacterium]|nr:hypothetical protein [Clostridia bacterium]